MRSLHFFSVLFLCTLGLNASALDEYRAKEEGNKIVLQTPYGEKSLSSEFRLEGMRDYKIEIPLSELRPAGEEEPEKLKTEAAPAPVNPIAAMPGAPSITVQNLTGIDAPITEEKKPEAKKEKPPEPQREVASLEPNNYDDADRLVSEANRLYNKGRYHEAMSYIDEVNRKRPTFVRGWVMKGSLMFVLGHKDLAKEAWEQALKLEPASTYIKDLMARYH